jgi:predicted 2-oxoglutarate/Fe(II)-dependent dioxygenase YbiX
VALIHENSRCAICGGPLSEPFTVTSGCALWPDHRLFRFCDAPLHLSCLNTWPDREEFSRAYYDAALEGCRDGFGTLIHVAESRFLGCGPWNVAGSDRSALTGQAQRRAECGHRRSAQTALIRQPYSMPGRLAFECRRPMQKQCLDGDRILTIDAFLTAEECASFVARSEAGGYEDAPITTAAGFVMNTDIRNNRRLIVDDARLARTLWLRAQPFLPAAINGWRAVGLNERFRFYRYDPGQRFAPHFDGCFERSERERSQLTFMVYLNADFTGGETKFYDADEHPHIIVRPEPGMALAFAHLQLHEGAAVVSGRKYVLRTDVMYTTGH